MEDPLPDHLVPKIDQIVSDVWSLHAGCRIGKDCDMRVELRVRFKDFAEDLMAWFKTLMVCGHPKACQEEGVCTACQSEAKVIGELTGVVQTVVQEGAKQSLSVTAGHCQSEEEKNGFSVEKDGLRR